MSTPQSPTPASARPATSPVLVEGDYQEQLSRGLWLVKWLLLIPHFVVLFFLWIAVVVFTVVAFVAILFTGRYPRSIFDFNVGVLRWTWRVGYYGYSALATDQYPPFSGDEHPDYPARLEIAYPEQLSRGLIFVKWLLALPHYLVLAVFLGTGWSEATNDSRHDDSGMWNAGLLGVLLLIVAIVLLFTARYPRGIFDVVLGMNRWAFRVAAYVGLMTDTYPPFRFDMGEREPGGGGLTPVPPASPPQ